MRIPKQPGSPKTDGKGLLLKTSTQLFEHGEIKLVPKQSLHPCALVFVVLEVILQATKGEKKIKLQLQTL